MRRWLQSLILVKINYLLLRCKKHVTPPLWGKLRSGMSLKLESIIKQHPIGYLGVSLSMKKRKLQKLELQKILRRLYQAGARESKSRSCKNSRAWQVQSKRVPQSQYRRYVKLQKQRTSADQMRQTQCQKFQLHHLQPITQQLYLKSGLHQRKGKKSETIEILE